MLKALELSSLATPRTWSSVPQLNRWLRGHVSSPLRQRAALPGLQPWRVLMFWSNASYSSRCNHLLHSGVGTTPAYGHSHGSWMVSGLGSCWWMIVTAWIACSTAGARAGTGCLLSSHGPCEIAPTMLSPIPALLSPPRNPFRGRNRSVATNIDWLTSE